ncbi:IPT/TIG domain-containing protein [Persicobacter psychrovividus]|uniref:IPT/TIG domain-containing protein n=1 Tax=Persicobacter psychrovividus TaxID=387638 RepID=A0ABM7VHY3_9BACT|nr:hypothetical protein PEPS_28640 [Persicobacter psychrovividus]
MRKLNPLILLVLLLCLCTQAFSQAWQSMNPGGGGQIQDLYFDPEHEGWIWFSSDMEGTYLSKDYGESWQFNGRELAHGMAFTVCKEHASAQARRRLYQGGLLGAHYTDDDGAHWRLINETKGVAIASIAISADNQTVLLGPGWQNKDPQKGQYAIIDPVQPLTGPRTVFISHDAGASWQEVSYESTDGYHQIYAMNINPVSGDIYIAAAAGLYISRDQGHSFSRISNPAGTSAEANGGIAATSREEGACHGVAISPDGQQLYAIYRLDANHTALLTVATEEANDPSAWRSLMDDNISTQAEWYDVKVDPRSSATNVKLLIGTGRTSADDRKGLWEATVAYASGEYQSHQWQLIADRSGFDMEVGWQAIPFVSRAFDYSPLSWSERKIVTMGGMNVFLGHPDAAGWPTSAESWTNIYCDPSEDNFGHHTTWSHKGFASPFTNDVWAYKNYVIQGGADHGVLESWDYGKSWTDETGPEGSTNSQAVAVVPTSPAIILADSRGGYGAAAPDKGKLYAKVIENDAQQSERWFQIGGGGEQFKGMLPRQFRAIAVDPQHPERVYVGARTVYDIGGIWTTEQFTELVFGDGQWTNIANSELNQLTVADVWVDPNDSQVIWVLAGGKVFRGQEQEPMVWSWRVVDLEARDFYVWDRNGQTALVAAATINGVNAIYWFEAAAGKSWEQLSDWRNTGLTIEQTLAIDPQEWVQGLGTHKLAFNGLAAHGDHIVVGTELLRHKKGVGIFRATISGTDVSWENWATDPTGQRMIYPRARQARVQLDESGTPYYYMATTGTGPWKRLLTATEQQNPIQTGSTSITDICLTENSVVNVALPFTYEASIFSSETVFSVEISDPHGLFGNPTVVGTITSDGSGQQEAAVSLPTDLLSGTNYRLRVVDLEQQIFGTENANGGLTIIKNSAEVKEVSAEITEGEVLLQWQLPQGCFEEVWVVVAEEQPVGASSELTGTGEGFTASPVFGEGTTLLNGFLAYKGLGTSVKVENLSPLKTYHFRIFTRNGSFYAEGIETSSLFIFPPQVQHFVPATAAVGEVVRVEGKYFTDLTGVSVNGKSVEYRLLNDQQLELIIMPAHTSGPVQVSGAHGSTLSEALLYINPKPQYPLIFSVEQMDGADAFAEQSITVHAQQGGFVNDFLFDGTASVINNAISEGYEGASGANNVMFDAPEETFVINNIPVADFLNVSLQMGLRKNNITDNGEGMLVEFKTGADDWQPLFTPMVTGQGTADWHVVDAYGEIPEAENLQIRFQKKNETNWRLDDLQFRGLPKNTGVIDLRSFSPQQGANLDTVLLRGRGFSNVHSVAFGERYAEFIKISDTDLQVIVPEYLTQNAYIRLLSVQETVSEYPFLLQQRKPVIYKESLEGGYSAKVNVPLQEFVQGGGLVNDWLAVSGEAVVRNNSQPSEGYRGVSGNYCLLMDQMGHYFQVDGIDSRGFTDMKLRFGLRKNFAVEDGSGLRVEVKSADGPWQALQMPLPTDKSSNEGWLVAYTYGDIPATDQLAIRMTKTNDTNWRIDDLQLLGISGGQAPVVNAVSHQQIFAGDTVTVSGNHLTTASVYFGAVPAPVLFNNSETVSVLVPAGVETAEGVLIANDGQVNLGLFEVPQQGFVRETFDGNCSGNSNISDYACFQNALNFSGSGQINYNFRQESDYEGASAGYNAYLRASGEDFVMQGVDLSNTIDPLLQFAVRKTDTEETGTQLKVEFKSEGAEWQALPYTLPSGKGWFLTDSIAGLPSELIDLRFTALSAHKWRIDDINIIGEQRVSDQAQMTAFLLPSLGLSLEIDQESGLISGEVAHDTDLSSLTAEIKMTAGAYASPNPLLPQNFDQEVVYAIVAPSGNTKEYRVLLSRLPAPEPEPEPEILQNFRAVETFDHPEALDSLAGNIDHPYFVNEDIHFNGTVSVVKQSSWESDYLHASGGYAVKFSSAGDYLELGNINISEMEDPILYFGIYKNTITEDGSNFGVEISDDQGESWLSYAVDLPVGSGSSKWYYYHLEDTLPARDQLLLRFTAKNSNKWRLDDLMISEGLDENHRSLKADESLSLARIFPNPAKGRVTVKSNFAITHLSVMDMAGRTALDLQQGGEKQVKVNLKTLLPGMYLLKIVTDQQTFYQRLLVQ